MPTDTLPGFLERDIAKVEAQPVIDLACPLLRELVNDGTHVLQRCQLTTPGGDVDVHVAPLVLYRHMLEVTDGAEVLFSGACVTAAIPAIRSSFEACLQLEYVLVDDDALYRERSLSWLVGHIHDRLRFYTMLDRSTQSGKQFQAAMASRYPELPAQASVVEPNARRAAADLKDLLKKPHLQSVEADYQQRKPKNWYGLFRGPSNLGDLAVTLNRRAEYDILYRQFSRTAHGSDLLRSVVRTKSGKGAILPLRASTDLSTLAGLAASFMLRSKRLMLQMFRPGEDYTPWYLREMREPYNRLLAGRP